MGERCAPLFFVEARRSCLRHSSLFPCVSPSRSTSASLYARESPSERFRLLQPRALRSPPASATVDADRWRGKTSHSLADLRRSAATGAGREEKKGTEAEAERPDPEANATG